MEKLSSAAIVAAEVLDGQKVAEELAAFGIFRLAREVEENLVSPEHAFDRLDVEHDGLLSPIEAVNREAHRFNESSQRSVAKQRVLDIGPAVVTGLRSENHIAVAHAHLQEGKAFEGILQVTTGQ